MPGLDVENIYETDSSDNEENHSKLLNSVSQLDSTQRIKPAQRKEIASEVSEYNLSKGLPHKRNLINVKELAKVLGRKPEHGVITKKINNFTRKRSVLRKPLEKTVEESINRSVGFEKVKRELGKWDAIVTRNALKDQISFPLSDTSMKMQDSKEFLSQFRKPTPLEVEIAKVLKAENNEEKVDEDEFPLTYKEMLEKRKEMAQMRARLSYKHIKAQRQSKIKSKKYHRLLKREKIRQQIKEFELLQKTDPEAALKKLAELDRTRAKERASLRHRNTGKWAKNLSVRAKYDVETRKVLADQLKMSRELTQKVSELDVSEGEEEVDSAPIEKIDSAKNSAAQPTTDNPWMINVSKEVQDFVNDYRNFWSEKGEKINQNESQEKKKNQCNGINESKVENAVQNEKISINNKEIGKAQKRELSPKIENPKKIKISTAKTEVSSEELENSSKKAVISPKITESSPKSIIIKSKDTNINANTKKIISEETGISPEKIGAKKTTINSEETETTPKKIKSISKKGEVGPKNKKTDFKEEDISSKNMTAKKTKIISEETKTTLKKTKSDSEKAEVGPKSKKTDFKEADISSKKMTAKKTKINSEETKTTLKKTKSDSEKAEVGPKSKKTNSKEADISLKKITAKKTKINSQETKMNSEEEVTTLKKAKSNPKKAEVGVKKKKTVSEETDDSPKKIKINSKETENNSESLKTSPEKTKISSKKEKTSVVRHPTSGVWTITSMKDELDSNSINKSKAESIDILFDDLNEKLLNKATKKVIRIKSKLQKDENKEKMIKKKEVETEIDLSLKITNAVERPDLDEELFEGEVQNNLPETFSVYSIADTQKSDADPSIDPKNFIQITPKRLNTEVPENITGGEDRVDNEEEAQQKIIEEAFVDDDVVAEFNAMGEEEEKSKIKIDTSLPGWGRWEGTGIAKRTRKKPLFVQNIPSKKKKQLKNTYINENGNPNLKNHLVKDVPHPFKSVEAFEANIRAPVGRDWVPETAHRKLIEKQVVTKLGTIIEPMSENEIINLKKSAKSPYKGKVKNKN